MFIQTEQTPNPATLKFLPGREVMGQGTANFTDPAEAARSPLAERLFQIEGVVGVFLGQRLHLDLQGRGPRVVPAEAGDPRRDHGALHRRPAGPAGGGRGAGRGRAARRTRDRHPDQGAAGHARAPAVAQDGGDIIFQGFDHGIVYLHMMGACAGLPGLHGDPQDGHREHAPPLHPRGGRSPRRSMWLLGSEPAAGRHQSAAPAPAARAFGQRAGKPGGLGMTACVARVHGCATPQPPDDYQEWGVSDILNDAGLDHLPSTRGPTTNGRTRRSATSCCRRSSISPRWGRPAPTARPCGCSSSSPRRPRRSSARP